MDPGLPLDNLPASYDVALRMRSVGASDAEIAQRLGVDVAVIPALLQLGEVKRSAGEGSEQS
jgi:hypothetical protein